MNAPSSCLSADRDGVATLYRENHAWLRNWLAYQLRSWGRGVADDLAHDTFLRILASRDGGQREAIRQPRAYLTRIANCVLVSCAVANRWNLPGWRPWPRCPSRCSRRRNNRA